MTFDEWIVLGVIFGVAAVLWGITRIGLKVRRGDFDHPRKHMHHISKPGMSHVDAHLASHQPLFDGSADSSGGGASD